LSDWNKVRLEEVADIKSSNIDKKSKVGEKKVRLCNYTDVYKNSYINSDKAIDFMVATCSENAFDKFVCLKNSFNYSMN